MNKVTVDKIMTLNPCSDYTREVVENLWNGKESLSLSEILDLDIYINDKSWVLARLVPTETAIKWAFYCADKATEYAAKAAVDHAADAASYADLAALGVEGNVAHWTDWAARTSRTSAYANKDYCKTLYNLLEKLIEMTEENQND